MNSNLLSTKSKLITEKIKNKTESSNDNILDSS